MKFESDAVPPYLEPETDFDTDVNLPAAPIHPATIPGPSRQAAGAFFFQSILNLVFYCSFVFFLGNNPTCNSNCL
jgi:hypothetical protein